MNVTPSCGFVRNETSPPWASTIFFAIARPSPVPPFLLKRKDERHSHDVFALSHSRNQSRAATLRLLPDESSPLHALRLERPEQLKRMLVSQARQGEIMQVENASNRDGQHDNFEPVLVQRHGLPLSLKEHAPLQLFQQVALLFFELFPVDFTPGIAFFKNVNGLGTALTSLLSSPCGLNQPLNEQH